MAARSDISPARWRKPFLRWLDGVEAGWAIPTLLIGFVAVWMAFLTIAYFGGDLHFDVLETWTLGRTLEWGSFKHPPLMAWVARAWTSVFPLTNWSMQLMALVNSAIALWAIDLISRHFVKGDKRVIVLLLLMLTPIYQLHAQRFNANAVLLAVWPIATYCFLRSFETRQVGWAIACGVTAALAMLGKYYSLFLICSFIFAAICHPQRRIYLGSPAPWVSTLAGLVALGPHLHWLMTTGAKPFAYALEVHAGRTVGPALVDAVVFVLGVVAILLVPVFTWALIAGYRLKKIRDDFRSMNPGLLLLFLVSVGTIIFPVIASVGLGTDFGADLGLTRSFPVRHIDCLRHELPDRALLFRQSTRLGNWHCSSSSCRGGSGSCKLSKHSSPERGAQLLSSGGDGGDSALAPAIRHLTSGRWRRGRAGDGSCLLQPGPPAIRQAPCMPGNGSVPPGET
jgi:hypothetical protein